MGINLFPATRDQNHSHHVKAKIDEPGGGGKLFDLGNLWHYLWNPVDNTDARQHERYPPCDL